MLITGEFSVHRKETDLLESVGFICLVISVLLWCWTLYFVAFITMPQHLTNVTFYPPSDMGVPNKQLKSQTPLLIIILRLVDANRVTLSLCMTLMQGQPSRAKEKQNLKIKAVLSVTMSVFASVGPLSTACKCPRAHSEAAVRKSQPQERSAAGQVPPALPYPICDALHSHANTEASEEPSQAYINQHTKIKINWKVVNSWNHHLPFKE